MKRILLSILAAALLIQPQPNKADDLSTAFPDLPIEFKIISATIGGMPHLPGSCPFNALLT